MDLNDSLWSQSAHDYRCPGGLQADSPMAEEAGERHGLPSQIHMQKEHAA